MRNLLKLVVLVLALNAIRYGIGGPIESMTIAEPMHRVLPSFPEVFDTDFTKRDFIISLGYNYVMWFSVALAFHFMHPSLPGGWLQKSLLSHGISCLFFIGLAAVYMNHFTDTVKPFFLWSMVDAVILFTVIGLANALLYPRLFRPHRSKARPEKTSELS